MTGHITGIRCRDPVLPATQSGENFLFQNKFNNNSTHVPDVSEELYSGYIPYTIVTITLFCVIFVVFSIGVSSNLTKRLSPNTPNIRSFVNLLPNLRVLDLPECTWVNDNTIREIATSCSNLKSLNITRCNNVRGSSAEFLIRKCKHLETLILHRTGVRDEDMLRVKWQTSRIKEIDISNCYHLNDMALNQIVVTLAPQLTYLKCAFSDELLHDIITLHHYLPIKRLELHRRHPLNMKLVEKFLCKCTQLEALDTSLVPVEYETFKNVLNKLPSLKWFNFAGNESMKIKEIFKLIAKDYDMVESIGVNFYHSPCDHDLSMAIYKLIKHKKVIRKVNLQGTKIDEMYRKAEKLLTENRQFLSNHPDFHLPSPKFEDQLQSLNKS